MAHMLALGVAVVTIFAAADMMSCASRNPLEPSPSAATQELLAALRQRGLRVTIEGDVPRSQTPYFSVTARRLLVEGSAVHGPARIEVFEYASRSAASADAAKVSADGQPNPSARITWVATPRFYRQDILIVLYVGCDQDVVAALGAVLGPPFVVGTTPCVTTGA